MVTAPFDGERKDPGNDSLRLVLRPFELDEPEKAVLGYRLPIETVWTRC
jgi:hypothetical protein